MAEEIAKKHSLRTLVQNIARDRREFQGTSNDTPRFNRSPD
ncbi:hypothetical protein [Pelagicoccus sp. SDUM812002]|nr:hypothetical protein [Pelagicoccus sp. SDUM812002]MDQ8185402.1 hypothetical protein [Pelagicoccus sp. SDUM812002]